MSEEIRMPQESTPDFIHFVGSVVVHDEMHFLLGGNIARNAVQKFQELLMTMTPVASAGHFSGCDIQRRE